MKRSNNKILLITLVVLLSGFALSKVFRTPSRERNLEEHLVTLDTANVTAIHIRPASEKQEIKLVRTGSAWELQRDQATARVDMSQIKNALQAIREVHPERLVTRKKEKWADYKVDSTGTHVTVSLDEGNPVEFWVGKTSGGASCMRLEGDDEVYEVKESLDQYFNKRFAGWRNKSFLKANPEQITKIAFQYPGDSSFVVQKSGGKWNIDGTQADSAKVATYLNRFRSKTLSEFADDFAPKSAKFEITLSNDTAAALTLQGWKVEDDKWVVTSNVQEDVYFSTSDKSLMNSLFAGRREFLSK